MEQNTSPNLFDLHLDQQSTTYLREASKWAKFLSIVGFVICGFFVIFAFFAKSIFSNAFTSYATDTASASAISAISGIFLTILYLIVAAIYFFPCLFLYRFSVKTQTAFKNNDQEQLVKSFQNLKAYFKYLGILVIIVLGFYALFLIFFVIGLATAPRV